MNKEVYELREIILGLRRVYQDYQNSLKKLDEFITCEKQIGDHSFFLYQNGYNINNYEMFFKYLINTEGNILRPNQTFYNLSNIYYDPYKSKLCVNCPYVKVKKSDELADGIYDIMHSDFAKLIVRNNMEALDTKASILSTTLNEVNMYTSESFNTYCSLLSYNSYNDTINLTLFYNFKTNVDQINEILNDLLKTKFYKNQFSHYIYENINDVDTSIDINLYNYTKNINNSRTFAFTIDSDKRLLKSKKSIF